MSPPRRQYGATAPGRLEGTMLKVLAAELSDAGRLGRGKRLYEQGAVTDIGVYPGRVELTVQGSRRDPYQVMLATRPGDGVPSSSELAASCNCVDAETARLCKHGVAGVFALSNEISIEPDLLTLWRGSPTSGSDDDDLAPIIPLFGNAAAPADERAHDDNDHRDIDRGDIGDDDIEGRDIDGGAPAQEPIDDTAAEINSLLGGQHQLDQTAAFVVPDLGPVRPIAQKSSGDPVIDRLLTEIYDELDLGW